MKWTAKTWTIYLSLCVLVLASPILVCAGFPLFFNAFERSEPWTGMVFIIAAAILCAGFVLWMANRRRVR